MEILDIGESPKIADLMIKRVLVGKEDTQIPYIAKILIEEHVSAIPIIDKKKTPIGIVTRSDVLKTLLYKAPLFWVNFPLFGTKKSDIEKIWKTTSLTTKMHTGKPVIFMLN